MCCYEGKGAIKIQSLECNDSKVGTWFTRRLVEALLGDGRDERKVQWFGSGGVANRVVGMARTCVFACRLSRWMVLFETISKS